MSTLQKATGLNKHSIQSISLRVNYETTDNDETTACNKETQMNRACVDSVQVFFQRQRASTSDRASNTWLQRQGRHLLRSDMSHWLNAFQTSGTTHRIKTLTCVDRYLLPGYTTSYPFDSTTVKTQMQHKDGSLKVYYNGSLPTSVSQGALSIFCNTWH
jgi:hypothetical protein